MTNEINTAAMLRPEVAAKVAELEEFKRETEEG